MRKLVIDATGDGSLSEEAVKVNQRALIDKILARYSTKYTLFREMIQNADDATASEVQIRFVTKDVESGANELLKAENTKEERAYTGVAICNNGFPFRDEDFARIKSIADGNPDEQKIGFFGVGFYSSFSVSEEPCVLSGQRAMSFHWNGDMLFVTNGIPPPSKDKSGEVAVILDMVEKQWTVFDLPCRSEKSIENTIPDMNDFAGFLLRCLSFTSNISSIEVFVDGNKTVSVGQKPVGDVEQVTRPPNIPKRAFIGDKDKMLCFKRATCTTMNFGCQLYGQEATSRSSVSSAGAESDFGLIELVRVDAWFQVNLDK
eukprot:CAMPEP_0184008488 /NCGR_PEP_ID=MMETSP0954-20121128/2005_1 /TAXON_ID=627963 /ORGANISM="Aplanochytrium sp, Strain PBS07" /LENGTH=316 /DNA_ID=CAMNT_0026287611 /DNA_START=118 /DNA_END=1065 /DNA_ORIENTATION=+